METSILNFNKDKCIFLAHTTNTKTKKPVTTFMSQAKSRSDGIRTHGLLVPNQARYQLRYTPERKNRSSRAAAVWLGMRGSNSLGRSQSPLHYHYANPHRVCVLGVCPQRSYIIACGEPFVNSYFKLFCKNPQKP